MKNKLIILFTTIFISAVFIYSLDYIEHKEFNISDNYMAIFRGETKEYIYSTYIYKTKKAYNYINTAVLVNPSEETNSNIIVTSKGTIKKKKEIFKTAKKNNAYSYVLTKENQCFTIEEYKEYLKDKKKE